MRPATVAFSRSGSHPRPRYTLSHPPYHPAPLLLPIRTIPKKKFCPIFGVNLMILPIREHAATHLPPRGEPCDRRCPATSEASVSHGKPYAAPDMLQGPACPPLHAVPPPYHHAPLLLPIRTIPKKEFCPIFGVNLRILPIPGACRPASATPPHHRDLRSLWRGEPATPATRGLRLTPSGSGKPAPRRAAHPGLATEARSRGGSDESTPTQGSATATTPRRALRRRRPRSGVYPRPASRCPTSLPSRASPIAH